MRLARIVPVVAFVLALGVGLHLARRGSTSPGPTLAAPVASALREPSLPSLVLPGRPVPPAEPGLPSVARVQDATCRGDSAVVEAIGRWVSAPLQPGEAFALAGWTAVPRGGPTCEARVACEHWNRSIGDAQGLAARVVRGACGPGGAFATATAPMPDEVPVEVAEAWALASRRVAGLPVVPFSLHAGPVPDGDSWRRAVTLVQPGMSAAVALAWGTDGRLDGAGLAREASALAAGGGR